MCEVQRDVEESFQDSGKISRNFDVRGVELDSIYTALLRTKMVVFLQAFFNFMINLFCEGEYMKKLYKNVVASQKKISIQSLLHLIVAHMYKWQGMMGKW
jgi:hypothetical protein